MSCDCLRQKFIVFARTPAAVCDFHELFPRLSDGALLQVGLAEVFANFGVIRINRQCLMVIIDALVDITEFTGAVSDRAKDPSLVAVPHAEEELQRLCVTSILAEVSSGEIKILIAQSR